MDEQPAQLEARVIDPNFVLVYFDGQLVGHVVEANAELGYIDQYQRNNGDWELSRRNGEVRISYMGQEAVEVSLHPEERDTILATLRLKFPMKMLDLVL